MILMAKTLGLEMEEEPGGLAPEGWGRGEGGDVTNGQPESQMVFRGCGPSKGRVGKG